MNSFKSFKTFLLCCLFVLANTINANDSRIQQAKKLYDEKDYSGAANVYLELLNVSPNNAKLHYNLANAYYKSSENTLAILHYEKALKFNPEFKDAQHNLKLAEKNTIDKIDSNKPSGFSLFINKVTLGNNISLISKIALLFLVISFIGWFLFVFSPTKFLKKISFFSGTLGLLIALIFTLTGYYKYNMLLNNRFAIVYSPTSNIYSQPSDNGKKLFTLHEGTKVKIISSEKHFYKIILTNKNQGWIKSEDIKKI